LAPQRYVLLGAGIAHLAAVLVDATPETAATDRSISRPR
jgi:hypothetical protein